MAEAVRQRYALATGQGLVKAPSKTPSPGMAKGGKVKGNYSKGGSSKKNY